MPRATEKQRKKTRLENILKYKSMIEVLHREHIASGLTVEYSDLIRDAYKRLEQLGYHWKTEKVKPFRKWANKEPTNTTKGWKTLDEEMNDVFRQ